MIRLIAPFIVIIWIHFITDFIFQSRWIAENKGKNIWVLILHSIIYCLPFIVFGFTFAIINGILHGVVDFVTSKITTYFYKNKDNYGFFTTIGFDQALHITILFLTYNYIVWE